MEEHFVQRNSTESEKKSILVIDDCQDVLDLQRVVLEQNGYTVITAQSGIEAFEILAKISRPNLILLDMNLEDMTGIDFLKELENEKPEIIKNVPVVILSGTASVPESKAIGFIHKPYDLEKFISDVKTYLENGFSMPIFH